MAPYLYDPELAPREHFEEVVARLRCAPPVPSPLVEPLHYSDGSFDTYPHSVLPPTLLDHPETNPQQAGNGSDWGVERDAKSAAVTFRHSGWVRPRRLVRAALIANDIRPRPLARFDTCGSDPWVVVDADDNTRFAIHSNHCHSRWCTPCSRERAARIIGNLRPKLNDGDIRFLTLTMKHSDTPLTDQIDRIYDCFRKLRRAPFWKPAVDGGCAVLEVKHSHTTQLWHVHLHCLLDGRPVDVKYIKAEWWRITTDSYIIKIKRCGTADQASSYVTKYITKPVPSSVINKPDQLEEMIAAYTGRRLVLTWGTWRGVRLTEPMDSTVWKSIASLSDLYQRRDLGCVDAYLILSRVERTLPEARILAGRDPPTPNDNPIGLLF